MDRIKTFAWYVGLIAAFWIVSILLENLALRTMYTSIPCEFDGSYIEEEDVFQISEANATACNVNGYINFNLKNASMKTIEKCYCKIDLFDKTGNLAKTDYVEMLNMYPGETKNFNIKFKGNHIERFKVSIVESTPDKTNIINIFGWEIDLTDIFGYDFTEATFFGTKITDIVSAIKDLFSGNFDKDAIKNRLGIWWSWMLSIVKSVPWWGYGIGWCMIVGLL